MNDFQIAYEAWAPKQSNNDQLSEEERSARSRLKEACAKVWKLGWWNDYVNVGNQSRGCHYGAAFGFKVRDENTSESDFTRSIQKLVAECGFSFEEGELTVFE